MMNLIITLLLVVFFIAILLYDKQTKDYEEVFSIIVISISAVVLFQIMKLF